MKTAHRINELANQLNELQACLGRPSRRPRAKVVTAQRLAAELAFLVEEWQLETLRIPEAERVMYRTPNPYCALH